jgi:hypothetical protein
VNFEAPISPKCGLYSCVYERQLYIHWLPGFKGTVVGPVYSHPRPICLNSRLFGIGCHVGSSAVEEAGSDSEDDSKSGYDYRGYGRPSQKPILGIFAGALGAAMFAYLAYRINNHVEKGKRGWPLTVIVGIVAVALVAQGTALFLSGAFIGSAAVDRGPENVAVFPIVIPELEFGNVQREIFGRNLVERAHNAALDEGPEPVNGLGVNGADNVLALAMPNALMRVAFQSHVAPRIIRGQQVNLRADSLADEAVQRSGIGMGHNAGDNLSLAPHGAHNGQFAGRATNAGPFVSVLVLVLPADIGFVNLDNAHQLAEGGIDQPGADAHAHVMGSTVRTETHDALHLKSGNALLAGQHHVDDAKPVAEANVGVFKDGAHQDREAVAAARRALLALPMKRLVSHWINLLIVATGAANAQRPAARLKIRAASIVVEKQRLKLRNGHLFGELRLGHRTNSYRKELLAWG